MSAVEGGSQTGWGGWASDIYVSLKNRYFYSKVSYSGLAPDMELILAAGTVGISIGVGAYKLYRDPVHAVVVGAGVTASIGSLFHNTYAVRVLAMQEWAARAAAAR